MKNANALIVAMFIIGISLPLAANIAGRDGADAVAENRQPARFPHFDGSWQSAISFGNGLSSWFDDHFGFRASLVRWYGESHLFGLHVSPTTAVVNGRDGWFFYADDEGLTDYIRDRPLTPAQLDAWRASTVDARDWLRSLGIAYVVLIAPDKYEIYPEEMPHSIHQVNAISRTDQVFSALKEAGVSAVDVRPALEAAKTQDRLFHKTDTHWNDRGALIAYQQLINAVRDQVPEVAAPLTIGDFTPRGFERSGMDLAGMMGLTRVLHETDLQLVPRRPRRAVVVDPAERKPDSAHGRIVTRIPESALPSALIFRDSFFSRLAPFVVEHFGRTTMLWQNDFAAEEVLTERPAIVIQEIVGRHLYTFEPSPELVPR